MVGKESGSVNKFTGYIEMSIFGKKVYAHRLAWIYENGFIPDGIKIDHINGIRSDNRIENLRLATHAQNIRNSKTRADNTSGVKGVSFDKSRGKWFAYVGKKFLGRFSSIDEAKNARNEAANNVFMEFANE